MSLPRIAHMSFSATTFMKWGSLLIIGFALFLGTWGAISDAAGPVSRWILRYVSYLDRRLRLMFIFKPTGKVIVSAQAAVLFLYITISVLFGIPYWGVGLLLVLAGPALYVEQERRKRLEAIEFQVDNFVLALANALKTTPSIGGALNSVVSVVAEPIRSEIEMVTKEMKVGSTLDQALLHMAARIGSRSVDTALSAVLIGRTVGGNLPRVLETTAGSLREMQRLEGVIRSKTADGRMQLYVIGAMPAVLVVLMNVVWPGYFNPLTDNIIGYVIVVGVVIMWASAIVVARKVLAVDI